MRGLIWNWPGRAGREAPRALAFLDGNDVAKKKKTTGPSHVTRERPCERQSNGSGATTSSSILESIASGRTFSPRGLLGILVLGMLVVGSYWPVMLYGGFVWDDVSFIVENSAIPMGWSGLRRIWFVPSEIKEPHYWPMTYTSFWLEHKLWGFTAAGYHVVNVLLHVANTLLLRSILLRLAVPGAWIIAAVFAVHPLHVESVAWVIERKDLLASLFYLACVLTWLRFLENPAARPYGLALALLAAAGLAKTTAVTLPAALLILHWWKHGRVTARDLTRLSPFFVVALGIAAIDLLRVSAVPSPLSLPYSMPERALMASRAFWFYVGKLLWPAELAVIYPIWDVHLGDAQAWAGMGAGAALVGGLWFFRHRIGRGPLAGTLFFAVALSPTLGFVDHKYMAYSFVAERYQYLASIGFMAVVLGTAAYAVGRLPDVCRKAALGLAVVTLLLLGTLTWRQSSIYSDEVTFFSHVISHNPQAQAAHLNLSKALFKQERWEEAAAAARVAVQQRPDSHKAHLNLGAALSKLERFDEAEQHVRQAVEIAPHESQTLVSLGALLSSTGKPAEAEQTLRRALAADPGDLGVVRTLATLLNKWGRDEEALDLCNRMIERGTADASIYAARGNSLYRLQRYDEAMASARQALSLDPDPPTAFSLHILMGQASWAMTHSADAAAEHYERALLIEPNRPTVLADLASLRIAQERYEKALELFQTAVRLQPDVAKFYSGMGFALYRLGRRDEAVRSLERALSLDPTLDEARTYLKLARSVGGG